MFQICSGTQKIACNDFSPHQFYHLPLCYQFSTYGRQRGCSLPRPEQPYPSAGHVVLEHVGHPAVGAAIGLGLLGLGYFYKDNRSGLAGSIDRGVCRMEIAEALHYAVQLPDRPFPTSLGLASSQTGVAFALASALNLTFSGLGSIFFALAILAGIARLYTRSNTFGALSAAPLSAWRSAYRSRSKLIPSTQAIDRYVMGFSLGRVPLSRARRAGVFFISLKTNSPRIYP